MNNNASRRLMSIILVCAVCTLAAVPQNIVTGQTPVPEPRHAPAQKVDSSRVSPELTNATLLSQDFEGGLVPPAGWSEVVNNPDYHWEISTGYPHGGDYAAIVEFDTNQDEWLLSLPLTLTQGTLSFWSYGSVYWCRTPNDFCDLKVWIVVGSIGGGDDVLLGKAESDWASNWSWTKSTYNLTPHLTGGAVRIGFEYTGNDGADITLDDISVGSSTSIFLPLVLR